MSKADINELLRRRYLLEFLLDSPQTRSNAVIAAQALSARGLSTSVSAAAASARWLAEIGAIRVEAHGDFLVMELTGSGLDYAEGRETHEGIAAWRPRA